MSIRAIASRFIRDAGSSYCGVVSYYGVDDECIMENAISVKRLLSVLSNMLRISSSVELNELKGVTQVLIFIAQKISACWVLYGYTSIICNISGSVITRNYTPQSRRLRGSLELLYTR